MVDDLITIVIPTSVLPSHPSTKIIDETLESIKVHLPDAEIILQLDGLRSEQQGREADYNAYKNQILWDCLHNWQNVLPVVFDELHHQSGMLRETIDKIRTPLMLYVEGDAPLVNKEIDWQACVNMIMQGKANTIRFHHENVIPKEHKNLILESDGNFTQTIQWSQRPHLSSVKYYKDIVLPTLPEANFIEDTFHGIVMNDYHTDGMLGWYKHRLWIYTPSGGIQRSYTTDGREGTRKYTTDDETWGFKK